MSPNVATLERGGPLGDRAPRFFTTRLFPPEPLVLESRLRAARCITTSTRMNIRATWRRLIQFPVVEWTMFALGVILLAVSPLVGAIPGPGGVLVAALGLALILKSSSWAKRHYVRFKRSRPKAGRWTDWALQRQSAKRREKQHKLKQPSVGN
jgi:hypothetical protein